MRRLTRLVPLAAAMLALVVLTAASAGCGGGSSDDSSPPEWQKVATAEVSGKAPVKLNLGVHPLGTKVRLGWKLSGPDKPPVMLTLRLINVDIGTGFGYSMTPDDQGFKLETDNAMTIAPLKPGNFRIFFTQRFPQAKGPGYSGKVTVYTLK